MTRAAPAPVVLLVEDEELISHLVAEWLSEHGFAVRELATAEAALDYLGGGGDANVLLTDINLPGGMDGAELAREAREMRPDLPIVYASGRHGYSDLAALVPRALFLPKPYNCGEVCKLLARLTGANA
jgi:CheY-like chemotaxis protein